MPAIRTDSSWVDEARFVLGAFLRIGDEPLLVDRLSRCRLSESAAKPGSSGEHHLFAVKLKSTNPTICELSPSA